jgi:hypothetical protein
MIPTFLPEFNLLFNLPAKSNPTTFPILGRERGNS